MATGIQRFKTKNIKLYYRPKAPSLRGCPQKRGVIIRLRIKTPRKPNSARRPVAKLFLSTRRKTIAHIPGLDTHYVDTPRF